MERSDRKIYIIAFLISLFFHVILLIILGILDIFSLNLSASELNQTTQPLVLEFEQPPPQPKTPQSPPVPPKLYKVVENPNADQQNPNESGLLAENASRAAAPELQKGDNELASQDQQPPEKIEDLVELEESPEPEQAPEQAPDLSGSEPIAKLFTQRQFSKQLIGKESHPRSQQKKSHQQDEVSPLSAKDFKADLIGEMRMNTYAWAWAPWWKSFERRILHFWYAPTAWQMGLISGYTYVKIRVNKQGELVSYQVLKHVGHPSLRKSSVNALESVFPFKALPPDFPEDYLEIRFVMIYPDLKELFRQHQ